MSKILCSFDPRNDRLARSIRNEMARAFVKCLDPETDLGPVSQLIGRLLSGHQENVYADYVKDRQQRYLAAKATIASQRITDDFYRALVLWDNELFFETHEVLESLWMEASGTAKLILQALIRAAGYYIHLGVGNQVGAEKMAARASAVLVKYRGEVPPFPGLDNLLECLARREPVPPKLL
ncbi:MAG: DUF309 domain-containing protein [Thermodesulfobacteriota bacterium]